MKEKYHDLKCCGRGQLRRYRQVSVRGTNYPAVDMYLYSGAKSAPRKRYFQLRVVGQKAKEILRELDKDNVVNTVCVEADVLIGDIEPKAYTTKSGEVKDVLYGRLLQLTDITVGGHPLADIKDKAGGTENYYQEAIA